MVTVVWWVRRKGIRECLDCEWSAEKSLGLLPVVMVTVVWWVRRKGSVLIANGLQKRR